MKDSRTLNQKNHMNGREARVSQQDVAGVYDSLSTFYNVWGKLTESKARTRALELADIEDGQRILEVAAGTGLAFHEIVKANPGGRNVGIDLSEGMLAKARQRLKKPPASSFELKIGSAFDLQEKDESFDLLINNYMFDLIPFSDMGKILNEFGRVLKKNGRLIMVNMTMGENFGSGIYDRLYSLSPKLMGGCRGIRLSGLLEEHGFHVKTREYYQQLLFPSEVISAEKS